MLFFVTNNYTRSLITPEKGKLTLVLSRSILMFYFRGNPTLPNVNKKTSYSKVEQFILKEGRYKASQNRMPAYGFIFSANMPKTRFTQHALPKKAYSVSSCSRGVCWKLSPCFAARDIAKSQFYIMGFLAKHRPYTPKWEPQFYTSLKAQ